MDVTGQREQSPRLQPRWFIRTFWIVQRALYSVTRGRIGLRTATPDRCVPIAAGTGAALGLLFGLMLNEVILSVAFGAIVGALVGRFAAAVAR